MFGAPGRSWQAPLFHIGKLPIHLVGLIVLIEIVSMLINILSGNKLSALTFFSWETFANDQQIWRLITYPFFSTPNVFWALGLYFFYHFGQSIEENIGREKFLRLCLSLLLIGPAIATVCHFAPALSRGPVDLGHANAAHLAIFSGFCAMFPNARAMLIGIKIKWLGLVLVLISALQYASAGQIANLLVLLCCVAFAVYYIRRQGFDEPFRFASDIGIDKRGLKRRQKKQSPKKKRKASERKLRPRTKVDLSSSSEVDRILDKINEHGFQSLTAEERDTLEKSSKK